MDVEIPVLSGSLIVPTQSGFSLNRISKKVRLCLIHIDNTIVMCEMVRVRKRGRQKKWTQNLHFLIFESKIKISR